MATVGFAWADVVIKVVTDVSKGLRVTIDEEQTDEARSLVHLHHNNNGF